MKKMLLPTLAVVLLPLGCESTPHYNRTKVDHGSANAKKGRPSIDVAVVANLAVTWGLFL